MGDSSPELSRHSHNHWGMTVVQLFWRVTRWARAMRFWLLLALAALAWFGFGSEARAQAACTEANRCGQAEALAMCNAKIGEFTVGTPAHLLGLECLLQDNWPSAGRGHYNARGLGHSGWTLLRNFGGTPDIFYFGALECADGKVYDTATGRCECPSGMGTSSTGACESCSSRNSQAGFSGQRSTGFSSTCAGGCTFAVTASGGCTSVGGVGGGVQACFGEFEWTGQSCRVPIGAPLPAPIPAPPQREECLSAGAGQTMCIKPNGDHCATASTGRQICWKPGETGDKGDGATLQTRGPGEASKPPANATNAGGDAYVPTGQSITTVTTRGDTSITTTTTNYATTNGTDADNQRDGVGEGEDSGSASGGGDCSAAPIVSDPALAMVATQAWATRCAVEAGNAAAVTGDVGNCAAPFSVEGTSANAEKLRALRVQICGALDADTTGVAGAAIDGIDAAIAAGDGVDPDVLDGDVEDAADPSKWREIRDLNDQIADLDDSGFLGARSCPIAPSISVAGASLPLNFNPICSMFIDMSGLLLALAYVVAARIIAGVK